MIRYQLIVEGQVQGVGFRSFCQLQAMHLDLTGTVRNMDNGMVEIFIQGARLNIDTFISVIKQGNMFINVEDISIKEVQTVENEKKFRPIY